MPSITITLDGDYEKINPDNPLGLKYPPLYHQQRTYDALKSHDIVINTYNTGTGKTRASLLRLFDLTGENVLFIAPTNELIHQHSGDIQKFVEENSLDFHVVEVTGQKLRELQIIDDPGYRVRNARKLHELIQNPRDYFPALTGRKPLILVTNPDLFYLSFYMAYSPLDERNLFRDFLTKFDYIVIDEFHYYSAKQLANFLTFFTISKEYGYFDGTRKVCLLSATPDDKILDYLNRVGSDEGLTWTLIDRANEPQESTTYEKIKTLSQIELTVHSGKMRDALATNPEMVGDLINAGQDGAIISNALRTISDIKQVLERSGMKGKFGLITGAVDTAERQEATSRYPLVLATPTVDIGYNFEKFGKSRQNIDFVFFDAFYAADFTQRLGRAGRLLSKTETAVPSVGHAFADGKLYSALKAQGQETFSRKDFANTVRTALGEDNRFYHYIESYAVLEAFQPIYHLHQTTLPEHQDQVRRLFNRIKDVFAPDGNVDFDTMMKKYGWHRTYKTVVDASNNRTFNDYVRQQWERAAWSYCRHQSWLRGTLDEFKQLPKEKETIILRRLLKKKRQCIADHAAQEYHLIDSIFNFRNSEVGIRCGIYDPNNLFQNTSNHTEYDLFHVLSHCRYELIEKKAYHEFTGAWGNYCDFYVHVSEFRSPPSRIEFYYQDRENDRETFEQRQCGRPIALKGLRVGLQDEAVRLEIQHFLADRYLTCLVSRLRNRYALNHILETRRQIDYPLSVTFADGARDDYRLILGSQAFEIAAELRGKWKEREDTEV